AVVQAAIPGRGPTPDEGPGRPKAAGARGLAAGCRPRSAGRWPPPPGWENPPPSVHSREQLRGNRRRRGGVMGFFDWLFGRRPKAGRPAQAAAEIAPAVAPTGPQPHRPRPTVIAGTDDSPHLLVDTGNGMVTMMDRDMFDYLYGESKAPDPAQRDLDELL